LYLKPLDRKCSRCKVRRATVEAFNDANGSLGSFCRRCARELLRAMEAVREDEPAADKVTEVSR